MLTPQKKNTTIGAFRTVELVGKDDDRLLYLALHRDIRKPYWLLESSSSLRLVQVGDEHAEYFNVKDKDYVAFPAPGSSVATVSKQTKQLGWKFITSRWVGLCKDIGYFHSKGQVYQQRHSLNFENLVFNDTSQILPLSYSRSTANNFAAPESRTGGTLTPASDVYTLGASLLALLGASSPDQLIAKGLLSAEHGLGQVLQRAMDVNPAKRYKDGNEFAKALVEILPDLEDDPSAAKRILKDKKGFSIAPLAAIFGLLVFFFIVACGSLFYFGVPQSLMGSSPPVVQVVVPSPTVALPAGSLDFDLSPFNFSIACRASADAVVRKGGQPIPNGVAATFETLVGGNLVLTTWTKSAPLGQYHLEFPSAPICTNGGTIRLTAKVQSDAVSKSLYFDPNKSTAQKFSFTAVQIDAAAYPQIVVYFSLAAPDGSPVRLSGSSQVQIEQDNVPVTNFVMTFVDPTSVPATVALVLDVSGSMNGKPITDARQAATDFINQLGERDAVCIYSFSTQVTKVQTCISDRRTAINSLNKLVASGNTSLYDGITAVAADHAKLTGRQSVIVLSDGADTASKSSLTDSVNRIKQTNIPVYAVGLVSRDYKGDVLKQLASSTGGSYLEAPSSNDLRGLYNSIQGQIKTQYRVVFTSLFPDRKTGSILLRILIGGQMIEASRPYFVK